MSGFCMSGNAEGWTGNNFLSREQCLQIYKRDNVSIGLTDMT
uniref:Uncharacterized protein n=1 Tax=uncultured Desulfobacterales bacterium HF0200_07G10 TaxID=710741 RepID=E0XU51_9BACT|nr:hypothetical protein [uncultured Desulfobacterales bacterium HF0200_07G10]